MSKELDNVYEIKNAIKYLKGNPNIKEDSYSLEALYYIEQALTELEELKCDVKRFMELDYQGKNGDGIDDVDAIEYTRLHIKLSKVGNEE